MTLSDEIRSLRERVLDDLNAAHDYYTDTKIAWRLVHKVIAAGHAITIRNMTTGSVTTGAQLAAKARGYVTEQLTEATFQQFLSIFENFILDFLRLWLTAYPKSLGKRMIDFKSILDLPDKDAIAEYIVSKELSGVLHDRPTEWFAYLEEKVKLGCPSAAEVERLAEAKVTRDVLVHNRGIANKTYESKAGRLARFKDGEKVTD